MNDLVAGPLSLITRHWWSLILRGIMAVIFGILSFLWPGFALEVVVLIFGIYALADGLREILQKAKTPPFPHNPRRAPPDPQLDLFESSSP